MNYPLFSVRDTLVGFGSPFVDANEDTARRGFSMQMNNPQSMNNFSPKDFDLYKIGEFDPKSGKVTSIVPELVCSGVSVLGD